MRHGTASQLALTSTTMSQLPKTVQIADGWQYSLTNANGTDTGEVAEKEWESVKNFPTTVHVELLNDKKIPDPVRSTTHKWRHLFSIHVAASLLD